MLSILRGRTVSTTALAILMGGCARARGLPACGPGRTRPRSAIAWSAAPPGDLSDARGRVVDARSGAPLSGSYVWVEPGHRVLATDSLGGFRLAGLAPGVYHVRVRRLGYEEARDSVRYGMGGLRLLVALAPAVGIVDYGCTVPARQLPRR